MLSGRLGYLGPSHVADLGLSCTFQPFKSTEVIGNNGVTLRPSIICLNCGGYLNQYVKLEESTDRWMCPLCNHINGRFHSANLLLSGPNTHKTDILKEIYVELQSSCFEVCEEIGSNDQFARQLLPKVYILAIDAAVCEDGNSTRLLETFINSLEPNDRVAVIVLHQTINILRLCDLNGENPIGCDVLPAAVDLSASIRRLLEQQIHLSTAQHVANNLESLTVTLNCLAFSRTKSLLAKTNNRSGSAIRSNYKINMDSLLAVTNAISILHQCGSHLLFATASAVYSNANLNLLSEQYNRFSSATYSNMQNQGFRALYNGCWIDIVQISSMQVDISVEYLHALASITGGRVLTTTDIQSDEVVIHNIRQLLLGVHSQPNSTGSSSSSVSNSSGSSKSSNATGTAITAVVLHSALLTSTVVNRLLIPSDVQNLLRGSFGSSISSQTSKPEGTNSICIDENHVKYSAECEFACSNPTLGDSDYLLTSSSIDELYNKSMQLLFSNYSEEVDRVETMCLPRCDVESYVSTALSASIGTQQRSAADSLKFHSTFATCIPSSHIQHQNWLSLVEDDDIVLINNNVPDSNDNSSSSSYNDGVSILYSYVQLICRHVHRDGKHKTTRVQTVRIPITTNILTYIHNINEYKFAESICRYLVCEHHSIINESCMSVPDEAAAIAKRRRAAVLDIEAIAKSFIDHWPWKQCDIVFKKLVVVLRYLFHLAEGPLLNGPAMHKQDSYLLRANYLAVCNEHSSRYIVPKVWIQRWKDCSMLPTAPHQTDKHPLPPSPSHAAPLPSPPTAVPAAATSHLAPLPPPSLSQSLPKATDNWVEAPADTMSFIPHGIAVVDMGDVVIVRRSDELKELDTNDNFLKDGLVYAHEVARMRYPRVNVLALGRSGMSKERYLMSRLNPSHTDAMDVITVHNNILTLANLNFDQLQQLVASCMPTDQISFNRFLSKLSTPFAQFRNQIAFGQSSQNH